MYDVDFVRFSPNERDNGDFDYGDLKANVWGVKVQGVNTRERVWYLPIT